MHFLAERRSRTARCFGEVALLGTFGALAPKKCWAVLDAANAGRFSEAAEIGSWFDRLGREVFDPLMVDRRIDGAYDKRHREAEPGPGGVPAADALAVPDDVSDAEFEQARQTLRERFPDCE